MNKRVPRGVPVGGLVAAAALTLSALLAACGNTTVNGNPSTPSSSTSTFSPTHKGGNTIVGGGNATSSDSSDGDAAETTNSVENLVDNTNGVQVFGSPKFGAYNGASDHIPYGMHVAVVCYVMNNTGEYGSVNALYKLKGGKWDKGWIPANVMLNDPKAELGDTNTPPLDPRVPACE